MARAKATTKAKTKASPLPSITPEDFAPYSEAELRELALRVETAPSNRLKTVITQSAIGAALLARCGSVEEVVRPLVAVWAGEEFAEAA